MADPVKRTKDLERILALPRRDASTPEQDQELADAMTEALKKPKGTMRLRTVQALALRDIGVCRGGVLPVGVGEGKTAISMMAAVVLAAEKPLLMLPATLITNAENARRALAEHFYVANNMQIVSYEMLGRESAADMLEAGQFDALISDESHRLKNLGGAACARRVARFMAKHPTTPFVAMSGTLIRDSLHDFAHLVFWALKEGAPLPFDPNELAAWAAALDEPKDNRFGFTDVPEPGALLDLCSIDELREQPVKAARLGFRRRLTETPGVVATAGDGESVGASLRITGIVYDLDDPGTEDRFTELREMRTPDGHDLTTGVEVWRHATELALGFHSIWDPWPPPEWLTPRKAWGSFVRAHLARSRTIDSPDQVKQGVLAGDIDDGGLLARWLEVEPTYVPNVVEVWHDDSVLNLVAKWAKKPGIVWVKHVFFAERLAKITGLPYFREGGFSSDGTYIENADCSRSIIASIGANRDGKNLQGDPDRAGGPWKGFSRNLLVGPPDGWDALQQVIARTHRPKQLADEVTVDILFGCREHAKAWREACAGTVAARDLIGGKPKLEIADVNVPSDMDFRMLGMSSQRW